MELNQIITGCQKNDRSCQKQLYDLYYAYGMKVASMYSNNFEDASEVVNDAFLMSLSKSKITILINLLYPGLG